MYGRSRLTSGGNALVPSATRLARSTPWRGGTPHPPSPRAPARAAGSEAEGDADPADRGFDRVEVLRPQPLQRTELGREPLPSVVRAVGQAGLAEAAVAPARGPADPVALDEHHGPPRVGLLGQQRSTAR